MSQTVTASLYAIFLWWFSTGVIFYLNARSPQTFRWSLLGATIVMALALVGLQASADDQSVTGAVLGFSCGLLIWGWHTMTYFMGIITGPRRTRCPKACRGWAHFLHAAQTGLYHELAIILTFLLMLALTWSQPNQFGVWTFVLLWVMHLSAKLNVFLGVRNLNKEFIPQHLQYLTGFFRRRAMNLLFPVSVTGGTVAALLLTGAAMDPDNTAHRAVGMTLLATMMALAVIEHWFMMLPIPAERLWRWSLTPELPAVVKPKDPPAPEEKSESRAESGTRPFELRIPEPRITAHVAGAGPELGPIPRGGKFIG